MPVLSRRQQMLMSRQLTSVKPSIEGNDIMGEPLYALEEDYERPQKEMDFPLTPLGKAPSRKASTNNLRLNTYTPSDLPERYMESEEEASPSPDSDTESNEEELKHKASAAPKQPAAEPVDTEDYRAEIAIAVPIMAVGRPKLVDICNIAPMQKRKRTLKPIRSYSALKNTLSRSPVASDGISPAVTKEPIEAVPSEDRIPKRQDSLQVLAPTSWLPDDVTLVQEDDDHYFPDLELRNPPTYNDYDPYSLDPPRLSPRSSYSSGSSAKKPGSVTRARNNSISKPPIAMHNGWKGLTRSLSIAKNSTLHRGDQKVTKKPKMVARAANERVDPLMIPSFPYSEKDAR